MAKARFSRQDAPWIEETAWIYMEHGFFKKFPNDAKLVDRVVKAFEARYGRPPKWNTPHENERLLALDEARTSTLPLLDHDRQPPLQGLYATAIAEWARIAGLRASKIREVPAANGRNVNVELVVGGKKRALTAKLYQHGQFDLTILQQMNKLLPKDRALYVVRSDGHEPVTLIVRLDAKGKRDIETSRGIRFWGPADWKKMTQVFGDREKEWVAEELDDA